MAETMPDDSSLLPIERLARSLMACAREQPSLLNRSRAVLDGAFPSGIGDLPRLLLRPTELLAAPMGIASDRIPYLEELVSIAVATARQAEDAARHASDAYTMARRYRLAGVGVGVLGIVIGMVGAIDAHWIQGLNVQPVTMASQARLSDGPRGAANDPAGSEAVPSAPAPPPLPALGPSAGKSTATAAEAPLQTAIPIAARPTWSIAYANDPAGSTAVPPVPAPPPLPALGPSPGKSAATAAEPPLPAAIPIAARPTWSVASAAASYPPPRPKYHPQRNHHVTATPRQPVVLVRVLDNLRRNVRAIFQ